MRTAGACARQEYAHGWSMRTAGVCAPDSKYAHGRSFVGNTWFEIDTRAREYFNCASKALVLETLAKHKACARVCFLFCYASSYYIK